MSGNPGQDPSQMMQNNANQVLGQQPGSTSTTSLGQSNAAGRMVSATFNVD